MYAQANVQILARANMQIYARTSDAMINKTNLRGRFLSETITFLMGHSVACFVRSLASLTRSRSACFACLLSSQARSLTSLTPSWDS